MLFLTASFQPASISVHTTPQYGSDCSLGTQPNPTRSLDSQVTGMPLVLTGRHAVAELAMENHGSLANTEL